MRNSTPVLYREHVHRVLVRERARCSPCTCSFREKAGRLSPPLDPLYQSLPHSYFPSVWRPMWPLVRMQYPVVILFDLQRRLRTLMRMVCVISVSLPLWRLV
jgi:hypothetical protein